MARLHGRWGHNVRPGNTDPYYYYGSAYVYAPDDGQSKDAGTKGRGTANKKSKRQQQGKTVIYRICDPDGKTLYTCSERKWERLLPEIRQTLPADAFVFEPLRIRLLYTLSELGFGSNAAFTQWCSKLSKSSP